MSPNELMRREIQIAQKEQGELDYLSGRSNTVPDEVNQTKRVYDVSQISNKELLAFLEGDVTVDAILENNPKIQGNQGVTNVSWNDEKREANYAIIELPLTTKKEASYEYSPPMPFREQVMWRAREILIRHNIPTLMRAIANVLP